MANLSNMQTQATPKMMRIFMWEITSPTADLLFSLSNILLAVGAAAVLIGTIGSITMAGVREHFSNERISANEAATARAIADSDIAKSDAAKAEIKLEQFRRTRRQIIAASGNADALVQKIKPFAGVHLDIGHAKEGREQWDFMWDLEPLLQKAGWIFVDWKGPQVFGKRNWTKELHAYGVANVLDVSIEINQESRDKLLPASQALADALNGIGIAVTVEPVIVSSSSINAGAIHLLVGEKR
jgi:hypothetical protein